MAFMRFDENPIREKTQVYNPDCLVVLDPSQKNSPLVYDGLKPNGLLVLNSPRPIKEKPHDNIRLTGIVEAERIALEEIGIPSPSTCMVGAFAATTGWIALGHIFSGLEQYFSEDLLKRNRRCAERGFNEVRVIKW